MQNESRLFGKQSRKKIWQAFMSLRYLAQLKEILSNPAYGNGEQFAEVWMDGAEERALKRSIMNLKNGLKPLGTCRAIA